MKQGLLYLKVTYTVAYLRTLVNQVKKVLFNWTCFPVLVQTKLFNSDVIFKTQHGQSSANKTKPGPSFQLLKWSFVCCTILVLSIKLTNLKLKTQPKQLLGSLPLVIALPRLNHQSIVKTVKLFYYLMWHLHRRLCSTCSRHHCRQ